MPRCNLTRNVVRYHHDELQLFLNASILVFVTSFTAASCRDTLSVLAVLSFLKFYSKVEKSADNNYHIDFQLATFCSMMGVIL